jgi:dipeptidyl aminopeptidase/acylaminoacyl peptidase
MPAKRPVTSEDLLRFQFVSDVQISPDGDTVLFTVTQAHPDKKENTYQSHIWKVLTKGGNPTQFTSSAQSESNPRWSPDGSQVCFTSGRDADVDQKGGQIWLMPSDGGEATKLTRQKHGAGNPRWSPDGKHILFSSLVPTAPSEDKNKGDAKSRVVHTDRLSYRFNGRGFIHNTRSHLFITATRGGKTRQLTSGNWDPEHAVWSPDGQHIYLTGLKEEDPDHTYARNLYRVSTKGGRLKKLTSLAGNIGSPTPSPDGKSIVFVGSDFSRYYGTNRRLYRIPSLGGKAVCLTPHLDLSIEQTLNADARWGSPGFGPVWSPDGKFLKFLATVRGTNQLFSLNIETGDLERYTDAQRCIESVSYSFDHSTAAYTEMTPTRLAEIHLWRSGKRDKQLTRFNTPRLSHLRLTTPERFSYRASDGAQVDGWIMIPPISRKRKYPGILQIHGGPRTAYGLGFMHEFQLLTAKGFAIYYLNPRGSSSYGEDWACGVGGHYGERDYDDIMEATTYVLKNYPIDSKRLGVTGGSYGGFMTNWIVGHTNRFKAACTQRCISNWVSFLVLQILAGDFPGKNWGGCLTTTSTTTGNDRPLRISKTSKRQPSLCTQKKIGDALLNKLNNFTWVLKQWVSKQNLYAFPVRTTNSRDRASQTTESNASATSWLGLKTIFNVRRIFIPNWREH